MTQATKLKRSPWRHDDIARLVREFTEGGLAGAVESFNGDHDAASVYAKLEALGLIRVTDQDKAFVQQLLAWIEKHAYPALVSEYVLDAVRDLRKVGEKS